jgi:GNAT superfamily N-acetyltransferase
VRGEQGASGEREPNAENLSARASAWQHAGQAAVCDVIEPWASGTVVRATSYPNYWDFNVVRVERDIDLSVEGLAAFADRALAGLEHRRVDVELIAAAERLRGGFQARGWKSMRLLWMRHDGRPAGEPSIAVEEVPYDAVDDLRVEWHLEDFTGEGDPALYHAQAREVALRRGVRVLIVRESGTPVAFAQLELEGAGAEITQVYVHPHHRGAGRGTAITRAAIEAARGVSDLWICADDEDRPKELYARLGFRAARTTMEFTRLPRQERSTPEELRASASQPSG